MLSKRFGLTLIEVLVVIAIVIVLALVLIPLVVGGKERSVRSACMDNMRQIALAVQNYARDNNGKVPPAYYNDPNLDAEVAYARPPVAAPGTSKGQKPMYPELWTGRLRKYIKSNHVLICPATSRDMANRGLFYRPEPAMENSPYTTYGMNWRFSNGGALGGEPFRPKRNYLGVVQTLESPPIPRQTVLLIETQNNIELIESPGGKESSAEVKAGGNVAPYGDWGPYFWSIRWLGRRFLPVGHSGGCNLVLADGHVAYIRSPREPYPPMTSQAERLGLKWW